MGGRSPRKNTFHPGNEVFHPKSVDFSQFFADKTRPEIKTIMKKNNRASLFLGIFTLLGIVGFKTSALGQG